MSYPLGSVDTGEETGFYSQHGTREARSRFGRLAAGLAVLAAIGLFAGGLWFAYILGTRHASGGGDVPLIRADERPTKVKPQNPGGMEIPDRDKLIYTQKRTGIEHLLPPPEKPILRPMATSGTQPEGPQSPAAATPAALPTGGTAPLAKQQQTAANVAVKAASATGGSPQAKTGAARIQLGSVRSEEAAQQEWNRLKRANAELLGSLSAVPVRADLGEKGVYYRIVTGPIPDADRVCRELNHRNVGCILVR